MIANWLPEDLLKATILFELPDGKGNFNAHGTGVLVNYKDTFILVTCKHIAMNLNNQKIYENLYFSVNRNDGTVCRYNISEVHKQFHLKWYFHKNSSVDLAVSLIAIDQGLDDIKLLPVDLYEDYNSMQIGEDIFFLGYPLGIGTNNSRLTPLVRGGLIASKNDDKSFFIDANVYPGSSGSPVFYRPTAADSKQHALGVNRGTKFLGIIAANRNYQEWGIIMRTLEPRVIFEENAGLGIVYSASLVREILNYPQFKAMLTRATKAQQKKLNQTIGSRSA